MDVHLVIYAAGFEYLKEEETLALEKNKWFPTSKDFEIVAKESGDRILALESSDVLANKLKETLQPNDILKEVSLIGHGNGDGLYLQGTLDPQLQYGIQLVGRPDFFMGIDRSRRGEILSAINKRVKGGTKISVYSCSSGIYYNLKEGFLQSVANAFAIPSQGFRYSIDYCILAKAQRVKEGIKVARIDDTFFDETRNRMMPSRGWVRYNPYPFLPKRNEQRLFPGGKNSCVGFYRTLKPLKKEIDSPIFYPASFRSRKK